MPPITGSGQAAASALLDTEQLISPVHRAVKGRLRLRIPGLKYSEAGAFAESLKEHLAARLPGFKEIQSCRISTLSGTVLIHYRPEIAVETIVNLVEKMVRCHRFGQKPIAERPAAKHPGKILPLKRPSLHDRQLIRSHEPLLPLSSPRAEEWYRFSWNKPIEHFKSCAETGLTKQRIAVLRERYGPNTLPRKEPRSGWRIFLEQLKSPAMLLLVGSAVLSIATGGIADSLVIVGAIGINSLIGFVTESNTEKIICSLQRLAHPRAMVVRDGRPQEVAAEELVPGDVVLFQRGSYVPADCRVMETQHLNVDESALTGESFPIAKATEPLTAENLSLGDRVNMAFMGTVVTGGSGTAVVVATGADTELGKIQTLASEAKPPKTPMERELERLGNRLVLASGIVCAAVFGIGLLRGYGLLQMTKNAITLAVAAVPEGLPAVATSILAFGVRKMRRQQVLIRRIEAVESLGSMQTICLDKTGTLTLNKMTVQAVYAGSKQVDIPANYTRSPGRPDNRDLEPELALLLKTVVLCNESGLDGEPGNYRYVGTPTENSLLELAIRFGIDVPGTRATYPLSLVKLRSEKRLFMETIHEIRDENVRATFAAPEGVGAGTIVLSAVKGNPGEVIRLCSHVLENGRILPLTPDLRERLELANEQMAARALRVLGVAYGAGDREAFLQSENPPRDLVWIGLVGMADPLREGVEKLISRFHQAGINTIMITGDQVPTAFAIGRRLNLSQGKELEVLESHNLQGIEPETLRGLARRVHVFARATPAQKLEIVKALQSSQQTVAMTGDGVNDGPALKAADIGVAMGGTGTDVAREVADVILVKDDLDTLIQGIRQGRTILCNIRKSIHYLFSTNMSEIMVMLGAVGFGLGQPLNPMQLLWINLISDVAPGLALSMENPEPDILEQPPRGADQPIVSNSDLRKMVLESAAMSAGSLGAYIYGLARYGRGMQAGTLAFTTLSIAQILHCLPCRSEKPVIFGRSPLPPNRYLSLALAGSLSLQLLTLFVPGLRSFLRLSPLSLADGLVVGAGSLLPLLFNETGKRKLD